MLSIVRCATLAVVLSAQTATAQIAVSQTRMAGISTDIILAQAINLSDGDKRRLDFYAEKIVSEMVEIRAAEVSADASAVRLGSGKARSYAERFATAAAGFGLTERETADYFLTYFSGAFSGPLPNALLSVDGNFNFRALFYRTEDSTNGSPNPDAGYIDQLRNTQNIGGVSGSN